MWFSSVLLSRLPQYIILICLVLRRIQLSSDSVWYLKRDRIVVGGANMEKAMIHNFTVTFGAKYLTGMVTSVPLSETFSLIKKNILHQSKNYKNHFENWYFWGMWPLGHVGHVTYSFINMLFISTGIFDDKLRPQILLVGTTANSPLRRIILIWLVLRRTTSYIIFIWMVVTVHFSITHPHA